MTTQVFRQAGQQWLWQITKLRSWLYSFCLLVLLITWFTYMTVSAQWLLFQEYWPMSATMAFGSFVAGATPQGGAAIAFPVFTKVLQIPVSDSRTFGLMIQSVGMTMAGILIISRQIKILPQVVIWTSLGSILGMTFGTCVFMLPDPYPRLLFTLGEASFGVALVIARWGFKAKLRTELPSWNRTTKGIFFTIGVLGSFFAAHVGSGVDIFTFIVLTLAWGIDEKISIPTTVIIMAVNSLIGFFLHGVINHDIGIVWNYWLVAVPVVAVGAPLGAWALTLMDRNKITIFILSLIAAETVTTFFVLMFTPTMVAVAVVSVVLCASTFTAMLYHRQYRLGMLPIPS